MVPLFFFVQTTNRYYERMSNPLLAERVLTIIGRGSIIRDTEVPKTVVLTSVFPSLA